MDTFWIWLIAGAILIGSALAAEVIHADSEAEALEIMMERLIVDVVVEIKGETECTK